MPSISFKCPSCAAPLKIRDRSFVGMHFDCPDCRSPLLVVSEADETIRAWVVEPEVDASLSVTPAAAVPPQFELPPAGTVESESVPNFTFAAPEFATGTPKSIRPASRGTGKKFAGAWNAGSTFLTHGVESLRQQPALQIAALATVGISILFVLVVLPPGQRSSAKSTANPHEGALAQTAAVLPEETSESLPVPSTESPGVKSEPELERTLQGRLSRLGEQLLEMADERGGFPTGLMKAEGQLAHDQRFSWLAELETHWHPNPALKPLAARSWRDPLNDRFVRRGLAEFQNPHIQALIGHDRYPATHFVGMAGVGADAPGLEVDNPRAGIFARERSTKLSDIQDGTSNTMLVAGVQRELGAWAAGGASSIRPLTREPYVNGPDGFGTGQPHSMFVLMADGSVREISKEMAPSLIRQGATIADGYGLGQESPLETRNVPIAKLGEPNGKKLATVVPTIDELPRPEGLKPIPQPVPTPEGAPQPVASVPVPLLGDPRKVPEREIDVSAALGQKILRFEQPVPAPLHKLLQQIEEMAGVPIDYSREELGLAAAKLDQAVSLKLKQVTVGEILKSLLERTGMAFRIEGNRIHLVPLEE